MMLQRGANSIKITMDRVAGVVFNRSLVEKRLGKCSNMFDGASFNRYNGACGCVAGATNCSDPHSAYGNVCPSVGRTCVIPDKEELFNEGQVNPIDPVDWWILDIRSYEVIGEQYFLARRMQWASTRSPWRTKFIFSSIPTVMRSLS